MATFRKAANGKWQAEIARLGVRKSKTLPTKQAAKDWAARQEHLVTTGQVASGGNTFENAFLRYARDVSPKRRGARWEIVRLNRFCKDDIAKKRLDKLAPSDLAEWRDARLKEVAPATVKREMELLSAVLSVARKEWGWISGNPIADVKRPPKTPPRTRRPSAAEMEALALSAGSDLTTATARAFHAFLFAVETGMRAGEIIGLTWKHVDVDARVAHLPMTKNGTSRDVPLSTEAVRLLQALPHADPVFDLNSHKLDALWRKLRDRADVVGLTFHDSRREAVSRLAGKMDVLDLARMIGHRDIRMLMVYYDKSAGDLAKLLD